MRAEFTPGASWDVERRRPTPIDYTKFKPNGDFCLIKLHVEKFRVESERQLLLIPELNDPMQVARVCEGEVLLVGPGSWNYNHMKYNPMPVKNGDIVICFHQNGIVLDPREPDYILLREADCICIPQE